MSRELKMVHLALERVRWSDIKHAYGPATDVPDLVLHLASPDATVRNEAWFELHGNLWHQGTIYEATAHAVPVFLELLRDKAVPSKHEILGYLALLFTGRSYWDVHRQLTIAEDELRKPGFQTKLEEELKWVEATKEAIAGGKEVYIEVLRNGNNRARIAAAYLLGVIDAVDIDTIEEVINAADER